MADGVEHSSSSSSTKDAGINEQSRPQFGNRHLVDPAKVFEHNAWDNVEWDEEQETEALKKIAEHSQQMVAPEMKDKYDSEADRFWNEFYQQHQNRFFKDRHWLFTEFPELASRAGDTGEERQGASSASADMMETCQPQNTALFPGDHARVCMLEVGCGVGNTVFPVLETNNDPGLFMYCCDFSSTAVDIVKSHPDYSPSRCHAFVCDIASPSAEFPFPESSLDVIILIFVLSALDPNSMQFAVQRLCKYLKPGGLLLFRDYGRYDMAQLRFKKGRCLSENFYVRGDGTRCYFFTQEEIKSLFEAAGLVEEQNYVDRRLQVNRGRQLKMYRVWIQCKYRKPAQS